MKTITLIAICAITLIGCSKDKYKCWECSYPTIGEVAAHSFMYCDATEQEIRYFESVSMLYSKGDTGTATCVQK